MDSSVANLRDYLLAALQKLRGTREFHVHILVSSPRKHTGLFPYAHPRPRVYLQDVLILLSEQASPDRPRVFVTALEAIVYNAPATSCGIVYISKVDSTGQGMIPSPTATVVKALLTYYADLATRPIQVDTLWVQLFARAQGQYLFPNSSDFIGKRPLTDVKLCVWWKGIFSHVAEEAVTRAKGAKLGLYYILPGLNELEAVNALQFVTAGTLLPASASTNPIPWKYGHQYSQTDIPLACAPSKAQSNLGHFIPSFDDDPKSRFIDEIAHTTEEPGVRSPERKRSKTFSEPEQDRGKPVSVVDKESSKEEKVQGELGKVSADEFWERMSFRQECIAGAVTGFFALGMSVRPSQSSSHPPASSPLAPQPGQVAPNLVRRVVASLLNGHEFSTAERAVRATETLECAIRGLCENITAKPPSSKSSSTSSDPPSLRSAPLLLHDHRETTPEPPLSNGTLDVPRTPPPKRKGRTPLPPDISPNPFPEPVASLETYHSHIYGSIAVNNPALPPKDAVAVTDAKDDAKDAATSAAQPVNVLAVRKKKRKAEA